MIQLAFIFMRNEENWIWYHLEREHEYFESIPLWEMDGAIAFVVKFYHW